MDFFKKHVDSLVILSAIITSMLWMNGKFNDIDRKFAGVEKDMAVIKTVMIMKNIMPSELAIKN